VPPVFDAIEWGSDGVLERTRTLAENAGLRVSVVDVIEDVDTADALFRVADSGRAQRTSAWIEDTPGIKDVK
jgi:glycosyltransferase A (GT-A) superfamily protein (DUF2064 family)